MSKHVEIAKNLSLSFFILRNKNNNNEEMKRQGRNNRGVQLGNILLVP